MNAPLVAVLCVAVAVGGVGSEDVESPASQLRQIPGAFELDDGFWVLRVPFPTDKRPLEDPHELIGALVRCMDDMTPSKITLDGKPVPVGLLCYTALRRHVYHEHTNEDGDIVGTWPGHVLPEEEWGLLGQAKTAWEEVLAKGYYTWL